MWGFEHETLGCHARVRAALTIWPRSVSCQVTRRNKYKHYGIHRKSPDFGRSTAATRRKTAREGEGRSGGYPGVRDDVGKYMMQSGKARSL